MIMGEIEPELVSTNVDHLEEKYGDEPEEQKKERLLRYQKAFEEYDKRYKEYMTSLTTQVNDYLKSEMQRIEGENKKREEGLLNNLEASIMNL